VGSGRESQEFAGVEICIYVYIYIYIYTCMYTSITTYIHVCISHIEPSAKYIYIFIYVYIYICMYTRMYITHLAECQAALSRET